MKTQFYFERLKHHHPMPWVLEQANEKGIEVRDARGMTVIAQYFGDMHELTPELRDKVIDGMGALARFLVELSCEQ